MTIGNAIRTRRKELKMSVDELAKRIGKNRSTIYRYESGDIENIPFELLLAIAKALDISPRQLKALSKVEGLDLAVKRDLGLKIETSSEWLSDRAEKWFASTYGFEFSDDEILLFYEIARYVIRIQNFEDYDERMAFLSMLLKQLNK